MKRYLPVVASALLCVSCGDVFEDTGALTIATGEKVNADEIPKNARPGLDLDYVGLIYDGSQLTPISYDIYADAEAFYLLVQEQRGWDSNLDLQDTQPFEIRRMTGAGTEYETVPLPRNIRPLENEVANGCGFIQTTEVGMLAISCNGEVAVYSGETKEWTYVDDPGEGAPTYVGPDSLYYAATEENGLEHPFVWIGGQRISLAELPPAFGEVIEHWSGPWDGERVRIVYKPDLLKLCASVWNLADGSVRDDGCLDFAVPGAVPKSARTIGGSVDATVLFGGGETNTKERGDEFWANVNPGSIEIVGRTSDRGNTLNLIGEDLGGPQVDVYVGSTEVTVGEGASIESYTFYELFGADGSYDFTTDFVNVITIAEPSRVCPDGEELTVCRAYSNKDLSPTARIVSPTRAWQSVDRTYDSRRRIIVKPLDILRGSERDITTTIDPNRVIDDYVPVSPVVPLPVWAQRVPGRFEDNVPSYTELSDCATVRTADGVEILRDNLDNFPVNMFDEHTIELSGCQPDDSGPPLNPVSVQALSLLDAPYLDPGAPYAWTMDGVNFTRGAALPISTDTPEVVGGGDGAMVLATDQGWMLIEASRPQDTVWSGTIIAPAGSATPKFIGNRRYIAVAGGAVYGLEERAEAGSLTGVTEPAQLVSLAHGDLLASSSSQGLRVWSTAGGVPVEIVNEPGARTAELLDVSDDGSVILERAGDVLRVADPTGTRQAVLEDLRGGGLQSAHMSADGTRVLLRTTQGGSPTDTLYTLSAPTATTWTVTPETVTTINGLYQFRRSTGEVFYQNDAPPGDPNYRAYMVLRTDGQRDVATQESLLRVASDALGNIVWFGPQENLQRANWDTLVVEDIALPAVPEGNLDPEFYTEDGYIQAIASGDWYAYDSAGALKRVSARGLTYPLAGGRGIFIGTPESNVDNGVAVWSGIMGNDASLLDPYEAALFENFADQVRAFNLLFSARQEDGAFLRAPCIPYRIDGEQPDYVTTAFATWFCVR